MKEGDLCVVDGEGHVLFSFVYELSARHAVVKKLSSNSHVEAELDKIHVIDDLSNGQCLGRVIALILSKEPDAQFCVRHDEFYFGTADDRYTSEERAYLDALGWREKEESWRFCT